RPTSSSARCAPCVLSRGQSNSCGAARSATCAAQAARGTASGRRRAFRTAAASRLAATAYFVVFSSAGVCAAPLPAVLGDALGPVAALSADPLVSVLAASSLRH